MEPETTLDAPLLDAAAPDAPLLDAAAEAEPKDVVLVENPAPPQDEAPQTDFEALFDLDPRRLGLTPHCATVRDVDHADDVRDLGRVGQQVAARDLGELGVRQALERLALGDAFGDVEHHHVTQLLAAHVVELLHRQ